MMKKNLVKLFLCAVFIFSTWQVYALDVSVGATLWYAWWNPTYDDMLADPPAYTTSGNYFKMDPAFMYGPMFSVNFGQAWKISATGLFGQYKYNAGWTNTTQPRRRYITGEEFKWDSDITLQYSLMQYLHVYFGIKYQGYTAETRFDTYSTLTGELLNTLEFDKVKYHQYGPGVGVASSVNIVWSLYMTGSFSIIGEYATDDNDKGSADYWVYGFNALAGVSYYIEGIHTTVSIGAKYQLFRYTGQDGNEENEKSDGLYDHFYGFYCTVIYRI